VTLIDQQDALDLVVTYLDFVEPEEQTDAETTKPDETAATLEPTDTDESTAANAKSPQSRAVESTVWHKLVAAATLGWSVSFVGAAVLADGVFGLLFFGSWIGMPLGMYLDSRRLTVGWPTRRWAYLLGSLIPLVAVVPGAVYLWRRRRLPTG